MCDVADEKAGLEVSTGIGGVQSVDISDLMSTTRALAGWPERRTSHIGFVGYGNTTAGNKVLIAVDREYDPAVPHAISDAGRGSPLSKISPPAAATTCSFTARGAPSLQQTTATNRSRGCNRSIWPAHQPFTLWTSICSSTTRHGSTFGKRGVAEGRTLPIQKEQTCGGHIGMNTTTAAGTVFPRTRVMVTFTVIR
jgi:hypothetical protein